MKYKSFSDQVRSFGDRVEVWRERVDHIRENPAAVAADLETAAEELRTAEEELRQQNEELLSSQILLEHERERYSDLFEYAPDPYIVTDVRGVILEANRAAGSLLGIQRQYLTGKSLLQFFQPEDALEARRQMSEVTHTFALAKWLGHIRPRGGEDMPVSLTATALSQRSDHGERCTGVRWLIREARELGATNDECNRLTRQFLDQREKHAQEIAQLQQIAQEDRAARLRAEETVRSRDQFLALVSHELRNPLTPVLMSLDGMLADDVALSPELRENIEMIRRNIQTQRRLIDDLLDVSRISHGKLELRQEPLRLHKLLEDVLTSARSALAVKRIALSVDLAAGDPWVDGDPTRVQQILWNLLHNATKFTPTDGQIAVRTRLDDPAGVVRIDVQDTGMGIRSEELATIFNPYRQSSSTFARRQGGLGLGLSIVQSLVRAHGGTVHAQSDGPGHGATFTVTLPVIAAPEQVPPITNGAAAEHRQLSICVIDDHVDTLKALSRLLTGVGHRVEGAGTVQDAIALLNAQSFDLIISDIHLPDGTGRDILAGVSREHFRRAIALTGMAGADEAQRCRDAGFDAVVLKPVSAGEILAMLS